jgi:hypothetical protein
LAQSLNDPEPEHHQADSGLDAFEAPEKVQS